MKQSHQSRWHRAINPIASYCAANPSARGLILAELNRIAPHEGGRLWNRQQVDRYLYPAGRRTEPLLGIGLALIESAKMVMLRKNLGETLLYLIIEAGVNEPNQSELRVAPEIEAQLNKAGWYRKK